MNVELFKRHFFKKINVDNTFQMGIRVFVKYANYHMASNRAGLVSVLLHYDLQCEHETLANIRKRILSKVKITKKKNEKIATEHGVKD